MLPGPVSKQAAQPKPRPYLFSPTQERATHLLVSNTIPATSNARAAMPHRGPNMASKSPLRWGARVGAAGGTFQGGSTALGQHAPAPGAPCDYRLGMGRS